MRKYLLLLISGLVILGIFWSWSTKTRQKTVGEKTSQVTTVLDFGDANKKEGKIASANAYEALKSVAQKNNLEIKSKQYDFGVFIESIGGVANSKEKAWIYFVNGKSAEVAADKYELKNGDIIEWKYIKPNF